MKKSISFKTFGLLSVMGLAGLGAFSCKKQTSSPTASALTPVTFNFKNVHIKTGGANGGTDKGRYDGTKDTLYVNLDTTRSEYFKNATSNNVVLSLPTSLFSSATGGNGDIMALSLDVEPGAMVTVSKKESKNGTDTTAFSFGLGKRVGNGTKDTAIVGLPKQLVKDNGIVENVFQGDVIVIQLNTTYANLKTLLGNASNSAVLTVTASKSGKASVTKTLTVKGSSSSS